MKTVLSNLDYSTEWTWTGRYLDGRKLYCKRYTKTISAGDNNFAIDGGYTMYELGWETCFDNANSGNIWSLNFYLSSSIYFIGWVDISDSLMKFQTPQSGTAYIVLYGW